MALNESDQTEGPGVTSQAQVNDRLLALAAFGAILFHPLLVSLFSKPVLVMGIPLLYFYLFGIWVLLIVALAVTIETAPRAVAERDPAGGGSF